MEVKVALAGNPNTGKTTIFNALTGSRQKTGNWPGVTVEKKEGRFEYKGKHFVVVDLPGTYSLSSYSIDERIARDFLVREKPDVVVVIVDASNLERNLYLVTLLLELEQNVVVALNMMDIAESKGINIDTDKIARILNVKVVPTVGNKEKGIKELKDAILEKSEEREVSFRINYGDAVEKGIGEMERYVKEITDYPPRFFILRLLEEDSEFIDIVDKSGVKDEIRSIIEQIRKNFKDITSWIIERRYGYIHGLVKECVRLVGGMESKIELTERLDRVFTNRFFGLPLFFFLMWLTFQIIFKWGAPLSEWIDKLFSYLGESCKNLVNIGVPLWMVSLLKDGIISGVGAVLVFFPNIFILFFIFAILEDSGYMARAAFVMDRIMHKIGLHGKSSISMILGFGCNVPAIMATRTLESRKDRILTILINPFMSCSARLPVYILFTEIFFPHHKGTVVFSLYLTGIFVGVITAKIFKSLFFKEEVAPLIMELPPYHLPTLKNIILSAWERSLIFLKKAGTIILSVVILIWILCYFPTGSEFAGIVISTGRVCTVVSNLIESNGAIPIVTFRPGSKFIPNILIFTSLSTGPAGGNTPLITGGNATGIEISSVLVSVFTLISSI